MKMVKTKRRRDFIVNPGTQIQTNTRQTEKPKQHSFFSLTCCRNKMYLKQHVEIKVPVLSSAHCHNITTPTHPEPSGHASKPTYCVSKSTKMKSEFVVSLFGCFVITAVQPFLFYSTFYWLHCTSWGFITVTWQLIISHHKHVTHLWELNGSFCTWLNV